MDNSYTCKCGKEAVSICHDPPGDICFSIKRGYGSNNMLHHWMADIILSKKDAKRLAKKLLELTE